MGQFSKEGKRQKRINHSPRVFFYSYNFNREPSYKIY